MESIKLWARNGAAVRQAIELGEIAHIETASEELTDEFLLFAIDSGLLQSWAGSFPDPRCAPEIAMEVILPAHIAARFAGRYSMRTAGYVLRSARVLGALGYSVEGVEPERASRRAVKPPPAAPAAPAARPLPPVLAVPSGAGWRPVARGASGTPWWGARQGGRREGCGPTPSAGTSGSRVAWGRRTRSVEKAV